MSEGKQLTNAILKEKMPDAMVYRYQATNLEECTQSGYYIIVQATASAYPKPPGTRFLLEVIPRSATGIIQRMTNIDTGNVYQRIYLEGVWKPWFQFQMAQVT